jgi:hypothetical protein
MMKDELMLIRPPDGGRSVRAPSERWTLEALRTAARSLVSESG